MTPARLGFLVYVAAMLGLAALMLYRVGQSLGKLP